MITLSEMVPPELKSELEDIAAECQLVDPTFDYTYERCRTLVVQIWAVRELFKLRQSIQYDRDWKQLQRSLNRD